MPPPLAYFLTGTTHGSWLHGDDRGSSERPKLDRPRHRAGAPSLLRHERDLAGESVRLDARARDVVREAIEAHCRLRGWAIHGLNVRTNHVHLVVCAGETPPERVLAQLKSWATRQLRLGGLVPSNDRVWTRHGSTRWINDHASLAAAIDYVTRHQD